MIKRITMTDFHSHILPKTDDGSSCISESIEMLTSTKNQGIDRIVATPHFYASDESPSEFLYRRNHTYQKLISEIKELSLPEIILGAEVGFFEGMSDCNELKDMVISGTSLLMVEMPVCKWSDRMLYEIKAINENQGIVPLIAHIDRYIKLLHDRKIINKLNGLPVLIQANSSFFINKKTSRLAFSLLSKEKIHLLGSDCHNTATRPQNLGDAYSLISDKLGNDALIRISDNEKIVFSNSKSSLEELFI